MLIKGLQKASFVDWDGKIATVLFCAGCNFKCGFCFNKELVNSSSELVEIPEKKILEFLESRKNFIDGVVITGGEPCLQKDLPEFIAKIKLPVKLDTNGSNPEILEYLIKNKLINYIAMDIKAPLNRYQEVAKSKILNLKSKILKSINLIIESGIDHEFRSTLVPGIHTEKDIKKMAQLIKGGKRYFLQNFKPGNTLDSRLKNTKPFASLEKFARIADRIIQTKIR
ncbi:MAG: anaerobic ribonucleoside-triphosphate reductase activating protein [Candidatus Portnoybacteria bacterium CG23_combo_of_CG06-09_8_20_14_all_37_13]|uniref:Anaerobic ribonucleoside-triphosphate reductase activating protein n=1 Tax=Candidatus Portnoybacteria bacterium CG23_combo_of_CG06-09_8_20_14_all_37_13 TaxID=1974819 RepID=A0A2G9YDL0_9BACT|nr:MAG: anaerobic ribonucleoside-triphosphate reductase activating protein [Candidatus Portnoybacteria bacterium CG23_combo_of_CG06-09_8_20_14_all_37_13]